MNIVVVLGAVGIGINWLLACLGMPHQIYENYKKKSVAGLSKLNFSLLFAAFAVSFLYGLSIANSPLIFGNILPLIFSGIIFLQMIYYKKS